MKDIPFAVRDSLWVPHHTAIVSFQDVFNYIQSIRALDVLSMTVGLRELLNNVMWDGFYGRVSDSMEAFYEWEEILLDTTGLSVDDFREPVQGLEEFLNTTFLKQLTEDKQYAFREEGFIISAWTSSIYAVISSTSGRDFPANSPTALRYWNLIGSMDVDPEYAALDPGSRSRRRDKAPVVISRTKRDRRDAYYQY